MSSTNQHGYVVQPSQDDNPNPNLVHEACGNVVSRIVPGDSLGTQNQLADQHDCPKES